MKKDGAATEFAEKTGNASTGHGVFVETLANGDKRDREAQGHHGQGHVQGKGQSGWDGGLRLHGHVLDPKVGTRHKASGT